MGCGAPDGLIEDANCAARQIRCNGPLSFRPSFLSTSCMCVLQSGTGEGRTKKLLSYSYSPFLEVRRKRGKSKSVQYSVFSLEMQPPSSCFIFSGKLNTDFAGKHFDFWGDFAYYSVNRTNATSTASTNKTCLFALNSTLH